MRKWPTQVSTVVANVGRELSLLKMAINMATADYLSFFLWNELEPRCQQRTAGSLELWCPMFYLKSYWKKIFLKHRQSGRLFFWSADILKLIVCLVMSHGNIKLCQYWFRQWLGAIRHQAIALTNIDESSVRWHSSEGSFIGNVQSISPLYEFEKLQKKKLWKFTLEVGCGKITGDLIGLLNAHIWSAKMYSKYLKLKKKV